MPGQANQKEEDLCEKEHAVPGVQRDPGVRRAGGKHRGRQSHSESNRLRQVSVSVIATGEAFANDLPNRRLIPFVESGRTN